jgi:NADPH2:quinone reductase
MSANKTMLAMTIADSATLKPTQRPIPEPSENQVLIQVAAAGVNRPDIMQRKGLYPAPIGASDIPGLEIAGTIVKLGVNVDQFKIGDKVCALVTGGGYAEYCLATAALCLPLPSNHSFIEAAGIPETFFTVWSNVFDRANFCKNDTVLVHGGTSGIGTTAVQLVKAFGGQIFVTAGSDAKCQFCLELGADSAINYQNQDFVTEINRLTNHQGVQIILDMIGGNYLPRNIKCMAEDARLVQIALQHGVSSELNLLPIMLKRLTITGSTLRARNDDFKTAIANKLQQNVWPLLANGKIRPIINSTFNLEDANQAHALMESSQHIGKIILTV